MLITTQYDGGCGVHPAVDVSAKVINFLLITTAVQPARISFFAVDVSAKVINFLLITTAEETKHEEAVLLMSLQR